MQAWLPATRTGAALGAAAPLRGGCRVNLAGRVAAVEISNEPAVSARGVTAECDDWPSLEVAVGGLHIAESFPDSLRDKR